MSQSYIRVICADNAVPAYNRIQLRTTPPTYIELQPGENILTVEEYPALKYGFKQIDDYEFENCSEEFANGLPYEYNGEGILVIDLSNFDATEMKSMNYMFSHMKGLRSVALNGMRNAKPDSMVSTFSMMGENMDELDLSTLDLSNVEDVSYLFSGCDIRKVILANCDFRAVENLDSMFDSCGIEELNFDGCKISTPESIDFQLDTDSTLTVSMTGCDENMVRCFAGSIVGYRSRFSAKQKQIFIVSESYSMVSGNDEDNQYI